MPPSLSCTLDRPPPATLRTPSSFSSISSLSYASWLIHLRLSLSATTSSLSSSLVALDWIALALDRRLVLMLSSPPSSWQWFGSFVRSVYNLSSVAVTRWTRPLHYSCSFLRWCNFFKFCVCLLSLSLSFWVFTLDRLSIHLSFVVQTSISIVRSKCHYPTPQWIRRRTLVCSIISSSSDCWSLRLWSAFSFGYVNANRKTIKWTIIWLADEIWPFFRSPWVWQPVSCRPTPFLEFRPKCTWWSVH